MTSYETTHRCEPNLPYEADELSAWFEEEMFHVWSKKLDFSEEVEYLHEQGIGFGSNGYHARSVGRNWKKYQGLRPADDVKVSKLEATAALAKEVSTTFVLLTCATSLSKRQSLYESHRRSLEVVCKAALGFDRLQAETLDSDSLNEQNYLETPAGKLLLQADAALTEFRAGSHNKDLEALRYIEFALMCGVVLLQIYSRDSDCKLVLPAPGKSVRKIRRWRGNDVSD